jgi:hypothetical protein
MKGKRTQIFIDLNTKGQATYHGLNAEFDPSLLIQLAGEGNVEMLSYQGNATIGSGHP